jgi:hypothetical protein
MEGDKIKDISAALGQNDQKAGGYTYYSQTYCETQGGGTVVTVCPNTLPEHIRVKRIYIRCTSEADIQVGLTDQNTLTAAQFLECEQILKGSGQGVTKVGVIESYSGLEADISPIDYPLHTMGRRFALYVDPDGIQLTEAILIVVWEAM